LELETSAGGHPIAAVAGSAPAKELKEVSEVSWQQSNDAELKEVSEVSCERALLQSNAELQAELKEISEVSCERALLQSSMELKEVPEVNAAFTANSVSSTVASQLWRPTLRPSGKQQASYRERLLRLQANAEHKEVSNAVSSQQPFHGERILEAPPSPAQIISIADRLPLPSTSEQSSCDLNGPLFCLDYFRDASGALTGSLLATSRLCHSRVVCEFDSSRFSGTYEGFWHDTDGQVCCRIVFDDGDCADVSPEQLCAAIHKAASEA